MVNTEAIWVGHHVFHMKVDTKLSVSEQHQVLLWGLLHLIQTIEFIHYTSNVKMTSLLAVTLSLLRNTSEHHPYPLGCHRVRGPVRHKKQSVFDGRAH